MQGKELDKKRREGECAVRTAFLVLAPRLVELLSLPSSSGLHVPRHDHGRREIIVKSADLVKFDASSEG